MKKHLLASLASSVAAIAASAAFICSAFTPGVYAWFSENGSLKNVFTTAGYSVEINETFTPAEWPENPVIAKAVSVVNSGDTPVLIRVSYAEYFMNGAEYVSSTVNGTPAVIKNWSAAFTSGWTDGGDGWYYYSRVLGSGSSASVLESVELNSAIGAAQIANYRTYDYHIYFTYDSVEADSSAVLASWSKAVTISGDGSVVYG